MPKITYLSFSGSVTSVQTALGMTVMRAAVMNGVPGIDADCGGSCACATCHVIVDPAWVGRMPPPSAMEAETLTLLTDPEPGSRLSCQIDVTEALDGLVVRTPASQG